MTNEEKNQLCLRCGNCCKFLVITVSRPSLPKELKESKDFLEARGLRILKENDKFFIVSIPLVCPHLNCDEDKDGGNNYSCDMYENRPEICRNFDGRLVPAWHDLDCKWKGVL